MEELVCKDIDGIIRTFDFSYALEENGSAIPTWEFKVYTREVNPPDSFFYMSVMELRNEIKVAVMDHNYNQYYKKKGIPEALILCIGNIFGKDVVSSSNQYPNSNEFRSDKATKAWERLVSIGKAIYDIEKDRFIHKVK